MEQLNPFNFHAEETDLDGNLMSWFWEEDRTQSTQLPQPEQASFGFLPTAIDGQYYYEGFGAPPLFLPTVQPSTPTTGTPRTLGDDLLSPAEGFSPAPEYHESPNLASKGVRKGGQALTSAQAKNRRAQKKFREKQKAKMINLSEEVEVLRKRVQDLSVENKDLENSNVLLSKVVKMRDRQMGTLQHKNESLMTAQKECLNGAAAPQKAITSGNEVLSMERGSLVDEHLTVHFPVSKFADVNNDAMKRVWKKYVDQLSELLIENDLNPNNPTITEKLHIAVGELVRKSIY